MHVSLLHADCSLVVLRWLKRHAEDAKLPAWTPEWLKGPNKQYVLGLFPTPIHRWCPPGIPKDVEFWIKRDDLTGMQLSGNKAGIHAFPLCLLNAYQVIAAPSEVIS